jgi:hypothetical protein
MNLKKRLEKIEGLFDKGVDSVTAIFLTAIGADNGKPDHKPLLGWAFEYKGKKESVLRRNDESEEDLCERASSYAFDVTGGQVTILTAIDETDIHALGVK